MTSDEATRKITKELRDAGWTEARHDGRHTIYRCPCGQHQVPVPTTHSRISAGVVAKIRRTIQDCKKGQR